MAAVADHRIRVVSKAREAALAPELPPYALEELLSVARDLQAEEIDLDHLLPTIALKARQLLRTDTSWIALYDEAHDSVRVATSCGTIDPDFDEMEVDIGSGMGGDALDRGCTLMVEDYRIYRHQTPDFVRDTLLREGIVSVICAPMMRGATMVGALYVGNRQPTRFGSRHGSFVATLAAQASVAIQNGRLYRRLVDKAQLLEATFEIHRQLGETAVAELGLQGVMRELARLTDRRLRLEQTNVSPFELEVDPNGSELGPTPDEPIALIVPVVAHDAEAGTITVYGERSVSELESNALAHGATVLALELLKHEAALAVESRLRRELLEELLPANGEPSPTQLVRARRLGFDLEAPHRLIVAELQDDGAGDLQTISRSLRHRHIDAPLWLLDGDRLVTVTGDDITVARRVADSIYAAAPTPSAVSVGISSSSRSFPTTYREAAAAAGLARNGGTAPIAVEYEQLGPLRFMLDVADLSHARALVREQLRTLREYDSQRETQLLVTLQAYVDSGGHHATIAAQCHVHPSTVKYRLRRIEQLTSRDLDDVDVRFELALAFQLLTLFQNLGIDLLDE